MNNLQIPLYLLALEQLVFGPGRAAGGSYLGLREPSRSNGGIWHQERLGTVLKSKGLLEGEAWESLLEDVKKQLVTAVSGIRSGRFHMTEDECPEYCEYRSCCRRTERRFEANAYPLNEQQTKAVTLFDSDLVVTAGAGTGKTKVLTSKYLRLLEERRAGVNEILAITFTNKAAAEMQDRIRLSIQEHLKGAGNTEEAEYWQNQLLKLESAKISTFHSFLPRLIGKPIEAESLRSAVS